MNITVKHINGTDVVIVVGRLDSVASGKLEEWAAPYMEVPKRDMILEFSQLEYISSAGLRVIFNISKVMKTHSCRFSICNAQDRVREVFAISGFDSFIPINKSIDDCLI